MGENSKHSNTVFTNKPHHITGQETKAYATSWVTISPFIRSEFQKRRQISKEKKKKIPTYNNFWKRGKQEKEEAFKTSSHEQKQFVPKKKKRNYSIQHNFYDQKLCLTHINYNEKPATIFLKKNNSQSTKQTRAKKMAGQKLKTQEKYKGE